MLFGRKINISPARIIILGFLGLILAGTGLLMLPFASRGPGGASFVDALFTATSATCVTGLVVQDTAQYWTLFGQIVILLLIQIGGMGVVTMAVMISMLMGKKIGLKQRWVMQESISAPQMGGILRLTGFILKGTFLIEGIGAALLSLRFCPEFGFFKGLWYAVFHSISAFCNAGFDLMGVKAEFSSLTGYVGDPLVNIVIMLLIIVGGLGFLVWNDILQHRQNFKRYRLQSKVVLVTTLVLLVGPLLFFLMCEFPLAQWQNLSIGEQFWAAAFMAVTPRTAGFNTVSLGELSQPGQLVTMLLMLVGGSPGSTAGGLKTTTLAVMILGIRAVFRRRSSAHCFGRRIPDEVFRNASALFMLYLLLFLGGGILICCMDGIPLMNALFESASAVATVGLSIGGSAVLSTPSRLILVCLMYFGRVGGLTMIYAVTAGERGGVSQYPQEQITVG